MSGELFGWLIKIGGFAGVCLGFCFMFIRKQHNDLLVALNKANEVQNQRNADKDAMIEKLLGLNDKWNETINAQIEVQEAQKNLLADLKQAVLPAKTLPPNNVG